MAWKESNPGLQGTGRVQGKTMTLRSIDIYHVAVPLKMKIRHASHERVTSDNLVVRATLDDGRVGYGEGVPRSYVTARRSRRRSPLSGVSTPRRHLGRPRDYADVVHRLDELRFPETQADPRGMAGNAARCAFELAILDAYGRRFGQSLGQAIPLVDAPGWCCGRDGLGPVQRRDHRRDARRERKAAWMNRIFGFKHVKVKVGVAGQDDPARLAQLRRILGRRMDLRIDANEAWPASVVVERVRPLLAAAPRRWNSRCRTARSRRWPRSGPGSGCRSCSTNRSAAIPTRPARSSGGRPTCSTSGCRSAAGSGQHLRIVALAQRSGLGLQLGCHPGETGLLSAAGRHVASRVRGFRWVEGSYDRHVLAENLTTRDVSFLPLGFARPLAGLASAST